jgi:hypothetical protein
MRSIFLFELLPAQSESLAKVGERLGTKPHDKRRGEHQITCCQNFGASLCAR